MGKAKLNNPVRQFCIFYVLGCSLLLTAFFPIWLAGPQTAYAQPLAGDQFPPLVTEEPAVNTPAPEKEKAQSILAYEMPVNGVLYYYGNWQSPITSDLIADEPAPATQVSVGTELGVTGEYQNLSVTEGPTGMGGQSTACLPLYASRIVEYRPGLKINDVLIEPPHENPENALGVPDELASPDYVSLGYRSSEEYPGFIILEIDALPHDYTIASIEIVETILGNYDCSTQPPTIALSVSEDGLIWQSLADVCQTQTYTPTTPLTFRYLKIQDVSQPGLYPSGENGYNLDGIVVTACEIATPSPTFISTPSDTPTAMPTAVPSCTPTLTITPSPTPIPIIPATQTSIPTVTKTPTRTDTPFIPTLTATRPTVFITSTTAPSVTLSPVVPNSATPIPSEISTSTNTPTPAVTRIHRLISVTPSPTGTTPTATPTDDRCFVSTGRVLKLLNTTSEPPSYEGGDSTPFGEFLQNCLAVITFMAFFARVGYLVFGNDLGIKKDIVSIFKRASILPPVLVRRRVKSLELQGAALSTKFTQLTFETNSLRSCQIDDPIEQRIITDQISANTRRMEKINLKRQKILNKLTILS